LLGRAVGTGFRGRPAELGPGPPEAACDQSHMVATMIWVRFTISRWDVLGCLADLGDLAFQTRIWGRRDTSEGFYDTFDEVVNLLDDLAPSPARAAVRWVLVDGPEVGRLSDLWQVLNSLLDEFGDVEFEEYLRHPRWLEVVRAARAALTAMVIAGPFGVVDP